MAILRGCFPAFLGMGMLLSACGTGPAPNDVSAGMTAQESAEFEARRATLRGQPIVPPSAPAVARLDPVPAQTPAPIRVSSTPVQATSQAPAAPTQATTPAPDVTTLAAAAIAEAETPAPLPPVSPLSNGGISDEQDFEAVAGRESIESDAERLARMQAERVVIAPTALPDRPEGIGPNIIDYALGTSNAVGEQVYRRRPISQARHERGCLAFRSADLAQEWFLQNGGPDRDRQGLDPDGDGFACAWNPQVYRTAAAAARN